MRIGDIYKNLWAGYESYFVYTGERASSKGCSFNDTKGYTITKLGGEWQLKRGIYSKQLLTDKVHFPIVGHIDLDEAEDEFVEKILKGIE